VVHLRYPGVRIPGHRGLPGITGLASDHERIRHLRCLGNGIAALVTRNLGCPGIEGIVPAAAHFFVCGFPNSFHEVAVISTP
jgi:hypothetical protein